MVQRAAGAVVAAQLRVPRPVGLARERLTSLLLPMWQHRLCLVTAPAGAGKTTLLAQLADSTSVPVAWYRAEASDAEPRALLACLERALCDVLPGLEPGWSSVEDAAAALEQWPGAHVLLIVDDLHVLHGTAAEATLELLLRYAPPALTLLAATRSSPGFNLSRMRVAGDLLEVSADDLRFRSWEVERLFRDVHREPLSPEELAELTRRTEGWAAGLQLFHLATEGRRLDERRQVLASLNIPARTVREYLAGNVIDQLPESLRRFLVDTCVLGRLSGPLCDEFLGRSDSARVLAELERRQIFTSAIDASGWYRYHEVLRSHLQAVLVEMVGEGEARVRHRRAGAALEEWGALLDALVAYCWAEDWEAVARLVGHEGEQLAMDPGGWLDLLPPALLEHDPWCLLATARHWRAAGRWEAASAAYRRAEDAFSDRNARHLCRRERQALGAWLEPVLAHSGDWSGIVRAAASRDPVGAHAQALKQPGIRWKLAAGLSALLAGHWGEARQLLDDVAAARDASPLLSVGARIGGAAAALLAGDTTAGALVERAADDAERLGAGWLAAIGRALLTLTERPGGRSEAASLRLSAERSGDPWGQHLAALLDGLSPAQHGPAELDRLVQAAAAFDVLGAEVVELWCLAARAHILAQAQHDSALEAARTVDARARALGVPGARRLAALALARAEPARADDHERLARSLALECGIAARPDESGRGGLAVGRPQPVTLRSFGGFRLEVDGDPVDLSAVRPRARAVLRLLGLQAGRSLHREVIIGALWPESDLEGGARQLHVAVSTLRRILPDPVRLLRDGDAYRLELPDDAVVDTDEFEHAIARSRRLIAAGDAEDAAAALEHAVGLHAGELLPEDGPAEWVVGPREDHQATAVQASQELADLQLRSGAALKAAATCERALRIDRYRDGLWRTLMEAYDAAGDRAAAAHARRRYGEVLTTLGLEPADEVPTAPTERRRIVPSPLTVVS